ncbi:MAG: HAMP domain-containing histidine kinase [Spirochaetia bacterium]|jgi:signal transduction histidine kinase|nr:HAMP domain-containing histidine kinase [Spirochaetia bacterium]
MTIKRRIFISNVRTVLVTLGGLFVFGFVFQILMAKIMGVDLETIQAWRDKAMQEMQAGARYWPPSIAGPACIIFFIALIAMINNLLNYRLIKNIVRPLRPLGEGVRQIHDNNLAFRIDYQNDDEYRPICDAFNEMAARLETSSAQKRKDEANRRELIAGISHDLRTPLTSIRGCLEGLETGVASTPQMREQYFATIKNKTEDMEHIIEQLFLFCKLDMNEFPLTLRRVALMPVIADMIEEAAQEYERRGLDIHIVEGRQDVFVSADTLLLRNVLINILENSVRYKTKERAFMEISAGIVNNSVFLRFTDDGPGVAADILSKLFDVFYRADPSRSAKGSGLGLAISKKIIEHMGGAMHAELPDSGGLAVVIRLPGAGDM